MTKAGPRCSVCDKPVDKEFRPFCSKRCADVDLSRWFNETYVIEGDEAPDAREDVDWEDDMPASDAKEALHVGRASPYPSKRLH